MWTTAIYRAESYILQDISTLNEAHTILMSPLSQGNFDKKEMKLLSRFQNCMEIYVNLIRSVPKILCDK